MSGTSYTQFYSLPPYYQPCPSLYRPYALDSFTPDPYNQFTSTNVLLSSQSQHALVNTFPEPSTRRKRASKPKVRSGCSTCKIRRVKCDEAKPACKRCTNTGRKCDGYQFPAKQTPSSNTTLTDVPLVSSPLPTDSALVHTRSKQNPEIFVHSPALKSFDSVFIGTVQERRAFHRFRVRTVTAFAGGSEGDFWTDLVLRAATSESVIAEAVVALSTLHEVYEECGGTYDKASITSPSYQEAAVLYGRAIGHLYQRIDTISGETANLAVIASILFACFEVLRRDNMAAVMHYQNGMRQLMKQMHDREQGLIDQSPAMRKPRPVVAHRPRDDLDKMLRVFARYDVQACTFSKPKAEALAIDLATLPAHDIGLMEVRRYLDNLLIAVYQLVKSDLSLFRYWQTDDVSLAWLEKRDEALSTFKEWLEVLEQSIPSDVITLRNHGVVASKSILGLILQVKIAIIMLETCIDSGPEETYDQFMPIFEEMISRVESMTSILALQEAEPLGRESVPFSMELGVVHPLFFIAWKCRDRTLRRRAIKQLKKCGKEGVWEGPVMAVMAERIMAIEEEGLETTAHISERQRIHDVRKAVEYDQRVIKVEMRLAQDNTWQNWTVMREAIPF